MSEYLDGLVVKEQSGFFWVEVSDGTIYMCTLRGRLMEEAQSSDIAAIGDRVRISVLEEDGTDVLKGVIEAVLPRKSALSKAARTTGKRGAGQAEREHVIIANADQSLFVFAAAKPAPDFRVLDRLLVAWEASDIEEVGIVINKVDLEDPTNIEQMMSPYVRMGYTILYTSAVDGRGIEALKAKLAGKISVFTGPSGVGKTSLLNRIQPGLGRAVRAVSHVTNEGTHTTRDSALIKLDMGGYIADTPGMRNMALWDVEPDELDGYFIDIAQYVGQCRFSDCTHQREPGCAVRAAVEDGAIAESRYRNYLHLRQELAETYIVYD